MKRCHFEGLTLKQRKVVRISKRVIEVLFLERGSCGGGHLSTDHHEGRNEFWLGTWYFGWHFGFLHNLIFILKGLFFWEAEELAQW